MFSSIPLRIKQLFALLLLITSFHALAADRAGIVLMHGKKGSPDNLRTLADDLSAHGYLVVTPEMPWSKTRAYDRTLEEAHQEIDAAVELLRLSGATRIAVAGHSMGANMALGYAATHAGIDAVMALGPGQTVESGNFREALGSSVTLANTLVAQGQADEQAEFSDLHLGKVGTARTTARIYKSYFDPAGLANMPATVRRIGVPLLWTVGDRDKNMLDRGPSYAFEAAKADHRNRYAVVGADHMGTPEASRSVVLQWLGAVLPGGNAIN